MINKYILEGIKLIDSSDAISKALLERYIGKNYIFDADKLKKQHVVTFINKEDNTTLKVRVDNIKITNNNTIFISDLLIGEFIFIYGR